MATAKTFPGVYTSITDDSFLTPSTSRFSAGLVGVASKGPLNTPTQVRSLKDFRRQFGASLGAGYFLADAVSVLSDLTDGLFIVRLAHEYTPVANCVASGAVGTYKLYTPKATVFKQTNFDTDPTTDVFLRITQVGLPSTVNAVVSDATGVDGGGTFITLRSNAGDPALAASYTGANVAFSLLTNAANNAESTLYAYTYGSALAGTLTGVKNSFSANYTGGAGAADWVIGKTYKITQNGLADTLEVRVASIIADNPVIIQFETSDISQVGYQALPLQDTYTAGAVFPASTVTKKDALYLMAATPGTWANGDDSTIGVYVKVRPGTTAGTKKLEVYENAALVETFDSLVTNSTSANFYETAINGVSAYITLKFVNNGHPANACDPWDTSLTSVSTPLAMPQGPINDGEANGTHGSFSKGENGEVLTDADIIGTIDPSDDSTSGIKSFEDTEQIEIDFLCAPGVQAGNISIGVMQEMNRVAGQAGAIALVDVPRGLTLREAVDWHNGTGLFRSRGGRIDSRNLACYWNWGTMTDRFSTDPTSTKIVPPTIGALRAEAYTFDNAKPWEAAAGEVRGLIPEFITLDFTSVSKDAKNGSYGNGNSVNSILLNHGRIMVFGERTMQVAESKLSVIHCNVLVHDVLSNMSAIGRRFTFDPNDTELLTSLTLAFTELLDKRKNERGIEDYNLVIDSTNNTPDTRNLREVIVDLFVIPTDSVERIFINAVVKQSGANLRSVTSA